MKIAQICDGERKDLVGEVRTTSLRCCGCFTILGSYRTR